MVDEKRTVPDLQRERRGQEEGRQMTSPVLRLDKAVKELADQIAEHLPEDWTIELQFVNGGLSISLIDPEYETADGFVDDDTTDGEYLAKRINYARYNDGLQPAYDDLDFDRPEEEIHS
jgi:hypothetical protein